MPLALDVSLRRRRVSRVRIVRICLAGLLYVTLVISSRIASGEKCQAGQTCAPPMPPDMFVATLTVPGTGTPVRLAYRDSAHDGAGLPVMVLLHGSPGTSDVFLKLTPLLPPGLRVIAPDLPGFGRSTRQVPDYSFRAHARYVLALLEELNIASAQIVGFSMGGGVALSMEDLAPERVRSIVMLSAIGVQEHELAGSYGWNHALHGAQLGALWLAREGLPHFGALDRWDLDMSYARNFFDSDQRPLRRILERYRGPLLIVHGTRDRNVPVAAALEHHRLAPQSELVLLDDSHFITFRYPEVFAGTLGKFLQRHAR